MAGRPESRNLPVPAQPLEKRRPGRSTIYTRELADAIVERLEDGENLVDICLEPGMPRRSTVYDWSEADTDGFAARFLRARVLGDEAIAARVARVSENPLIGEILVEREVVTKNGEIVVVRERRQEDMLGHRALLIKTHTDLLARRNAKYATHAARPSTEDKDGDDANTIKVINAYQEVDEPPPDDLES